MNAKTTTSQPTIAFGLSWRETYKSNAKTTIVAQIDDDTTAEVHSFTSANGGASWLIIRRDFEMIAEPKSFGTPSRAQLEALKFAPQATAHIDLTDPETFRSLMPSDREVVAARVADLVDAARALRWIAQMMSTGATDAAPLAACDLPDGAGPDWRELVAIAERAIMAATRTDSDQRPDADDRTRWLNELRGVQREIVALQYTPDLSAPKRDRLDSLRVREQELLVALKSNKRR